jgi:heme/copper-type cytochrome/quinol oxidase subunit 3
MSASVAVHAPIAGARQLSPARFGIWLFLVSEAMFFAALIAAYVVLRAGSSTFGSPGEALGAISGAGATLVLVASSACAWRALICAKRDPSARSAATWILVTFALGSTFLAIQGLEYRALIERGLSPRSNLYWSCFFVLTSLHGLHVLAGLIWLALVRRNPDPASRALRIELAVLYWQLVDFVWIALFALLYF